MKSVKQTSLKFGFALAVFLGAMIAHAQSVSVAISNDVVVLSDRERSGVFELVNFGTLPAEYRLTIRELPEALAGNTDFIRWAPRRAVAPGNRTIPVRIAARPPADLTPGEYVVEMAAQASAAELPETEAENDTEADADEPVMGMSVAVQPVLPVRIYYRHQIDPPRMEVLDFEMVADADTGHVGNFLVEKQALDRSFVGHLEIVHAPTGEILTKGRVHVPPGREPRKFNVNIPVSDRRFSMDDQYCMRLWDQHPAQGSPYTESCS